MQYTVLHYSIILNAAYKYIIITQPVQCIVTNLLIMRQQCESELHVTSLLRNVNLLIKLSIFFSKLLDVAN